MSDNKSQRLSVQLIANCMNELARETLVGKVLPRLWPVWDSRFCTKASAGKRNWLSRLTRALLPVSQNSERKASC